MPALHNTHHLPIDRSAASGRVYLITVTTQRRKPVFSDFQLGRLVVAQFKQADHDGWVHSLAWVVMPDHFHWLFELRNKTLAELMCRIKSRSSITINQTLQTQARLWQKGYLDRPISEREDRKAIARDLIQNPKRAGLARRLGDYPLWDAVWV